MYSILKKLAFCVLLGASGSAHAAPTLFPNGDFASAPLAGSWKPEFGGGTTTFNYPTSGGSGGSGGYGTMNNSGGWGIWIGNDGAPFTPLSSLGLTAGNGYTFFMDMKIEAGAPNNNLGRIKLEWAGVGGQAGEFSRTLIGDGTTWERYTYDIIIPLGATGFKVVPVVSDNSFVGFDNIGFESVPYYVAPLPPPPPSDVIVQEFFNVASARWGVPTFNGTGNSGSLAWSNTEGNPPGATILTATNPIPSGGNGFYTYTATGVNFGDGPVEISFDVKGSLVGSALHVSYNGNQVFDIQNSMNGATYTTIKNTYQLNQGFTATTTFTLGFQIAMGPVPGGGGTVTIDNIIVKTNLPASATPFAATIKTGKAVSWVAANPLNAYQPRRSSNGVVFSDFGPLVIGNTQTTAFDSPGSSFYQVLQSTPFTQDVVYNGGFALVFPSAPTLDGWGVFQSQPPTRLATGGRGDDGPCVQIKANNVVANGGAVGPNGSELQQNTRNAFFDALLDPQLGTVTPGKTYKLEFWAKQISSESGYVQNFSLQFLAAGGGSLLNSGALAFVPPVGGAWTKFSTELVAPAGATSGFIQIVGSTGADGVGIGEVLIDDVSLVTSGYTPDPTPLAATAVSSVEVSWLAALGKNYQVQSSGDLATWSNLSGVVAGEGSILAVYDSMVDPKKFYKVARLP